MSEETLNNLFEQARNEVPETKTEDILKWIGGGTLLTMLAAYLAKFKILFISKPLVMFSTIITVTGISVGTLVLLPTSGTPEKKTIKTQYLQTEKGNDHTQFVSKSIPSGPQEKLNLAIEFSGQEGKPEVLSLPLLSSGTGNLPKYTIPLQSLPQLKEKVRETGTFHTVEVYGLAAVILVAEENNGFRVGSEDGIPPNITVENANGILTIKDDMEKAGERENAPIYVSVKTVDKIICHDVTTITTEGTLDLTKLRIESDGASDITFSGNVRELEISANDGSNIELNINADKLDLELLGAANVSGKGEVTEMKIENNEAGNLEASHLETKNAVINTAGASNSEIHVTDNIDVTVTEMSRVKYKGTPKKGKITVDELAHFGRF